MKKNCIEWRRATPEEIESGSKEMIIANQYEIEDEKIDSNSLAFSEFIKMTPEELQVVKEALSIGINKALNRSSIKTDINSRIDDINVKEKGRESCWERIKQWIRKTFSR